jgi:hypothetical protein
MSAATLTTGSTPKLSEVARHLIVPEGIVTTVWPRVESRLNGAGIYFDRWQQGLGSVALGCRENGKYASSVGGNTLSIPRQVAKTFFVRCLVTGLCLEFPDTHWVWTSHHGTTTNKTFANFQALVQSKSIRQHLKQDRSNGIRSTNGQQQIAFRNGSMIQFGAREQGFGRGMDEVDGEVFDEAQILSIDALEDMVPATNQAKHPHGGLLFFMGTPPRPKDPGEAFTEKRQKAIDGKTTDALYVEISGEPGTDPEDESKWPTFNPSYPLRTPRESMLRMLENIPNVDSREREMMGIWPVRGGGLISPDQWSALADGKSEPKDPVSFGVYVSRSGSAAIGVAGYRADGKIHVGVVPQIAGSRDGTMPGLGWIPPRIKELRDKWKPCAVVIDERSEAGALIEDIQALNVTIETTTATKMASACVKFLAAVDEGQLRHRGTAELQASVCAGKPRDLLDSWAWDRKDRNSDITQLVAVTLALHGLMVNGRPSRSVYEEKDLTVV